MKILIIGGVAAGMSAAAKAKRASREAEVIVYDMGEYISWGACGLPYFVGGFFDDPNTMIARTVEKFTEQGIEVKIKHQVTSVDFDKKTVQVKNLITEETYEERYDQLMIATGASAIIPPIKNVNLENVFTLKTFEDGLALKSAMEKPENKDIIVIGAGFIGLELVEAAHNLGKNVRVIELEDRVMGGTFDSEITEIIEGELQAYEEIQLHLNESVTELIGDKEVSHIKTSKGEYKADIVVLATGVRPNTKFLKDTGIEMLANGAIIANEYGLTNFDNVYAAGDCATVPNAITKENVYVPLATSANKMGRIIGDNMAGEKVKYPGTLGSSAVKVIELEAARTGLSEAEAKKMNLNYKTSFVKDKNQTSYYPGQADIYVKLIYDADSKVILGGQMVGTKDAVLRVDVLAAAIYNKMTTTELGMLDLCYAPPFARTWDVLNISGNVSK